MSGRLWPVPSFLTLRDPTIKNDDIAGHIAIFDGKHLRVSLVMAIAAATARYNDAGDHPDITRHL